MAVLGGIYIAIEYGTELFQTLGFTVAVAIGMLAMGAVSRHFFRWLSGW